MHGMSVKEKHIITHEELTSLTLERARYVRLAQIYVRDGNDAEDIFHDCILLLINNRDRLYVNDIRSYFAASIKNRCLRYLKNRQRVESVDSGADPLRQYFMSRLQDNGEEDAVRCADFPELFRKCEERLPKLTLEVFEAKRLEKMSYKQISKMFGISENRINFEIKRALKVFREEFKDYHIFVETVVIFFGVFIRYFTGNIEGLF